MDDATEPADQDALVDVNELPISRLVTSGDSVLAHSVRRLLAELTQKEILSAFGNFAPEPVDPDEPSDPLRRLGNPSSSPVPAENRRAALSHADAPRTVDTCQVGRDVHPGRPDPVIQDQHQTDRHDPQKTDEVENVAGT